MILTKQKIYIITLVTVSALVALGVLVIYPWVSDIFSISSDLERQRFDLKKYSMREENFKKLKAGENEIDLTLRNLSEALISKENSLEFIVLLEKLAQETGNKQSIGIINIAEDDVSAKTKDRKGVVIEDPLEDISTLNFQVKLEGKYKNLLNYLLRLENLEIYTEVTSVSIKTKNTNANSGNEPFDESANQDDTLSTTLEIRVFSKE